MVRYTSIVIAFTDSSGASTRFIEHFSPYCGHCRRFAPTWTQLVEENQKLEDPGISLAQVNCAVDGGMSRQDIMRFEYLPVNRLMQRK